MSSPRYASPTQAVPQQQQQQQPQLIHYEERHHDHCSTFWCYYVWIVIFICLGLFFWWPLWFGLVVLLIVFPIHACKVAQDERAYNFQQQEAQAQARRQQQHHAEAEQAQQVIMTTTTTTTHHNHQQHQQQQDVEMGHHHQQQQQQQQNRRYVIAVVNKMTADERLGIHITQQQQLSNGQTTYIVESIEPWSPFRQTDLREGMTIESINGIHLHNNNNNNNAQQDHWRMTMDIMRSTVGSIIVVAETNEPSYATAVFPSTSSSSTQAEQEETMATVTATSVGVDLPPAYAPGFGTTTTTTTTNDTTMTSTERPVNIRTIAAVVNKTSSVEDDDDDDLGIHFIQNRQGDIVVLHLTRDSKFHQTELSEGMKVVSINGTDVQDKSVEFCRTLLATTVGTVIVVAEKEESPPVAFASLVVPDNNNNNHHDRNNNNSNTVVDAVPMAASATVLHHNDQTAEDTTTAASPPPANDNSKAAWAAAGTVRTVTAVAHKTSVYQPLGIAFDRSSDGIFSISQINADSPFASLGLAVGMKVLSINHVEVTGQDMSLPLLLLRESPDQVILTATATASASAAHPSPSPGNNLHHF